MEIEYVSQIFNDDKLKEWFEKNKLSGDINFDNPDFEKDTTFLLNKMKKYRFNYNVILTYEDIVKRYFISDEVYKEVYGPYALGYKGAKESDKTYSLNGLYEYIEKTDIDTAIAINGNVKRYFERNRYGNEPNEKDGLIRRLYKWGIEIDQYDNVSQCKLLYYIYTLEKGKNIRLFSMLNKPTLENVANASVDTYNGHLMLQMKRDISLEVSFEDLLIYNSILISTLSKMEDLIHYALLYISYPEELDINSFKHRIEELPKTLKSYKPINSHQHSIFEQFYLKLIEHENLGRQNDIIDLYNVEFESKNFPKQNQMFQKLATNTLISRKNVKTYFTKYQNRLSKIVFEKNKPTDYELVKYRSAVETLDKALEIITSNTFFDYCYGVPEKLLIVIMQVYIFIDKKQSVKNSFYGYCSSDIKRIRKEISAGLEALSKNQLATSKFIWDLYYEKSGKKEIRATISQYERSIDEMLKIILSGDTIEDLYYKYLNVVWNSTSILIPSKINDYVVNYINELLIDNFKLTKNELLINTLIPMCIWEREIINSIISVLNTHIENRDCEFRSSLKLLPKDTPISFAYKVGFRINFDSKEITLCNLEI